MEGISHIIVDEVHERSMDCDFLLVVLKQLIETNKNIKYEFFFFYMYIIYIYYFHIFIYIHIYKYKYY